MAQLAGRGGSRPNKLCGWGGMRGVGFGVKGGGVCVCVCGACGWGEGGGAGGGGSPKAPPPCAVDSGLAAMASKMLSTSAWIA